MTNKYAMGRLFRDGKTRLVIPNLELTIIDAATNIVSSFVTNPQRTRSGDWFSNSPFSKKDPDLNFFQKFGKGMSGFVESIADLLTVGLGVTKIETSQDYVMPFSKGIGSTGETIHLLGARNEIINLQFTTDRYPGRMGSIIRGILQKTMEIAQVVYLIDDLFLATPCLIRKTRLSKEANYRGAIMGSLELVSLSTGGSQVKAFKEGFEKLKTVTKTLKSSLSIALDFGTAAFIAPIVGAGVFGITAILMNGIVSS